MGITAKELRKALSPDVAALSAKALAELDGRGVDPLTLEANAGALGVTLPADVNPLAMRFEALWQRWDGPPLVREYKFSSARRWRLDYYCEGNGARIGIEIHGGVWTQGRHVRGKGFLADLEKLNAAQMLGITVLQLGTDQVDDAHVGELADYARRELSRIKDSRSSE